MWTSYYVKGRSEARRTMSSGLRRTRTDLQEAEREREELESKNGELKNTHGSRSSISQPRTMFPRMWKNIKRTLGGPDDRRHKAMNEETSFEASLDRGENWGRENSAGAFDQTNRSHHRSQSDEVRRTDEFGHDALPWQWATPSAQGGHPLGLPSIGDSNNTLTESPEPPFQQEAVDELADQCGWQPGQDRFPVGFGITTRLVRAGRELLGHGRTGIVEEVRCAEHALTFCRKRIEIPSSFKQHKQRVLEAIQREISIMRKIQHMHVVQLFGSYEEQIDYHHYYFLLMFPVGDQDLGAFLSMASQAYVDEEVESNPYDRTLRKWFGCLTSALVYLHGHGIHHEDIKPNNIIHKGEYVFFTDFGSSREVDLANQITSTEDPALSTRLFAAPEAMASEVGSIRRHGSKTDVFALGMVFVEMLTVLDHKDVPSLREKLAPFSPYYKIIPMFDDWFNSPRNLQLYTVCIKPMLALERSARPSAMEVLDFLKWRSYDIFIDCPCSKALCARPPLVLGSLSDPGFVSVTR